MARRSERLNTSQAIRQVLEQHPKAKAREIVDLLAQQHIEVNPALVYMIKGRLTQMNSHNRRRAAHRQARQKTGSTNPIKLIIKIKELASDAGGMENLRNLVSVLCD